MLLPKTATRFPAPSSRSSASWVEQNNPGESRPCGKTQFLKMVALRNGGPAPHQAAYQAPAAREHARPPQALVNPFPLPLLNPVPALVAESVWTQVGMGILRAIEAGTSFPALLAALLLLPQTAHAPGIPQHPPLLDKDTLRLAQLEGQHQLGSLTKAEQAEYLALLAQVRGIHLDRLEEQLREAHLRAVVPDYKKIEMAGLRNESIGEFDGVNLKEKMFIEDKSAEGLTTLNPRTGLPNQSAAQWAEKHVYNKTKDRIKGLKIAKYTYPQPAPNIEQIRGFRRLHFRIDANTLEVRAATEDAVKRLRTENPGWEFTAQHGKN